MEKEALKLNILLYFPDVFPEIDKDSINKLQQNLSELVNTQNLQLQKKIKEIFLKILNFIITKKLDNINNLKPIEFSLIEKLFIDFLWLDLRLFKSGNTLYEKIYDIIHNKEKDKTFNKILFLTDFIKNEIEIFTGLKNFLKEKESKKEYEKELFKLEEERMELSKIREKLLLSLGGETNQDIKKYITQSTKLEQEIPHIAEYNFKRKTGLAISPQERDNLIRLEKEIEDDNEWRETILSNFVKRYPKIVQEIRKINKAIETILNKEGEVLFYLNQKENFLQKFTEKDRIMDNEKKQQVLYKISFILNTLIETCSSDEFLPFQESAIIIDEGFIENLESLYKKEEKIIKHLLARKKDIPKILLLPFTKKSFYNKENNLLIAPVYSSNFLPIYEAFALFKWHSDTLHDVKAGYHLLKRNRGIEPNVLEKRFVKDYVLYLMDKKKLQTSVDIETYNFFERIFK